MQLRGIAVVSETRMYTHPSGALWAEVHIDDAGMATLPEELLHITMYSAGFHQR